MAEVLCPVVVGRAEEIAALEVALRTSASGEGRVVCITGEAGIGKSRLAREVIALARSRGAVTAVGRAVPAGASTPYRPLTEALSQLLRDRELPKDPQLTLWLPALGEILPTLTVDGSGTVERSGESSSPLGAEALIQLLRTMAEPAGLVLVLEDLHWADSDTLAVVEYLADNLSGTQVLCIATTRDEDPSADEEPAGTPEVIRRLLSSRSAIHVPVSRLDSGLVAEMVRTCVPGANDETVARVQLASDGIPFLVEELLASPGVPASLAETVRTRLSDFPDAERTVLSIAAIFGRHFDWRLVSDAADQTDSIVASVLERGVRHHLLGVQDGAFFFRHALTRDAVLERLLPPRRQVLATAALRAIDAAHPNLEGQWRDLAVDLTFQAGENVRAAELLIASGRAALARGALATAIDVLERAEDLGHRDAAGVLVEALALAGRVDDAESVGTIAIRAAERPEKAAELHIKLAHGAVAAARWGLADTHLREARALLATDVDSQLQAGATVLEAEVALATDRVEDARRLTSELLSLASCSPQIRCNALEVLGRVERFTDLAAAKTLFEEALAVAQEHDLALWQVRATHELGTIDMFDHAGVDRLTEARRLASEFGALSTAAELDLQLTAVGHTRFELDMAREHAHLALDLGEKLSVDQVRAKAFVFLAENWAWRGDSAEMERCIGQAASISPDNSMYSAFAWGARGMRELFFGDRHVAVEHLGRAAGMLAELPYAEPACFRAVWPVFLTAIGDRRAAGAIAEARRAGLGAFGLNAGLLSCAEGLLAGRSGDAPAARRAVAASERNFVNCRPWSDVVRWLAAESASAGGWDEPRWWSDGVAERLEAVGLEHPAARCRELAAGPRRFVALGITAREADVLDLVVQGLSNKEIALNLGLSPRTVEKHVEALLRKLAARSRTHLVAIAESGSGGGA